MSALLEATTGVGLIANPNLVVHLLLGSSLSVGGIAVGRVGGFGLLSLALACWPNRNSTSARAIGALFTYNVLTAGYLGYLGVRGYAGSLLWPACALHCVLALFFARPAYVSLEDSDGPSI